MPTAAFELSFTQKNYKSSQCSAYFLGEY